VKVKFIERTKAPTSDINWYGKDNVAFKTAYNMFEKHDGKYGNCTHYAIGRYQELQNAVSKFKEENADKFLDTAKKVGYPTGSEPKLGAVIVWKHTTKTNGHVGVIEKIYDNGDILVSMSGWKSFLWKTRKVTKKSGYVYSDYKLLGFIYYNDIEFYEALTYTGEFPALPGTLTKNYISNEKSTKSEIKKLQQFLNWANDASLTVDGIIGNKTTQQVKDFQNKVNITADGKFGKKSLAKAKEYEK
jgi:surface antigen